MNVHKNAVLTPRGREILISRLERGERPMDVATAMGVSASTVFKCRRRAGEKLLHVSVLTADILLASSWSERWLASHQASTATDAHHDATSS